MRICQKHADVQLTDFTTCCVANSLTLRTPAYPYYGRGRSTLMRMTLLQYEIFFVEEVCCDE